MQIQVFVDLDGVLADFDTGYRNAFDNWKGLAKDDVDWGKVRAYRDFYENLPPMPDFQELWDAVKHHNPIILTGLPVSVPEAQYNKRAWVNKHLGWEVPMIGCLSREKCLHGKPGDVLIDDWEKWKHLWVGMGGHFILHKSAAESIKQLNEYLESHHE